MYESGSENEKKNYKEKEEKKCSRGDLLKGVTPCDAVKPQRLKGLEELRIEILRMSEKIKE